MTHDYKYEQLYQEGKISEEERNGLIPAVRQNTTFCSECGHNVINSRIPHHRTWCNPHLKMAICFLFLALAARLQAGLIELPTDTQISQYPAYLRQHVRLFDTAIVVPWTEPDGTLHTGKGWVSLYGSLDGGTFFNTDLFVLDPTAEATLSWDFAESGYNLRFIVVNDGTSNSKMYEVRAKTTDSGRALVGPFGHENITTIDLYGSLPGSVPDAGSTILLLTIALIPLRLYIAAQEHNNGG